jgi:hypothetical protein
VPCFWAEHLPAIAAQEVAIHSEKLLSLGKPVLDALAMKMYLNTRLSMLMDCKDGAEGSADCSLMD